MIYLVHRLVYKYALAWTVETSPRQTKGIPGIGVLTTQKGAQMFENYLSNVKLQPQQGPKGESLTRFISPFPH